MPVQFDDDSFRQDPLGSLKRGAEELASYYEEEQTRRAGERQAQEEAERQAKEVRDTCEWAKNQVAAYSKSNPVYSEAFDFVLNKEAKKLERLGLSPHEINTQLNRQAYSLFETAKVYGRNPAELVFHNALDVGWKPSGAWVSGLSDDEFDEMWERMSTRARIEESHGAGPRERTREGLPLYTPGEDEPPEGMTEDWLWRRAGSGKRR